MKPLIDHWNGIHKGDPVRLTRNVYFRGDDNIAYEPPGKQIASRGMVGRFSAVSEKGILVYFNNGSGSVLGLVLDEFALEKHIGK